MPVLAVDPWWTGHHDDIVARALGRLRLESPSDPDLAAVHAAAWTSGLLIDARLDRCDPLPAITPEPVIEAAVLTTMNQYRRKDAPFGTAGGWADSGPQTPVYSDPLAGVDAMLAPYKQRRGLA